MLYGIETCLVKIEDTCRLQWTKMQMARWMCSISLFEQRPSEQIRPGIQNFCGHVANATQVVWPHRKNGN